MDSADPLIGTLHNAEITRSGDMNGREISGDMARLLKSPLSELSCAFLLERRFEGLDIFIVGLLDK